jgi:hypothetical protein
MEPIKLSDIVYTGTRFGRSVNLERDFYAQVSLDDYVLTTTARDALRRIAQAASIPSSTRAFTLTGPYGSGKSAFALFAAKALSYPSNNGTQVARNLVKDHDTELWHSFFDRRRRTAIGSHGLCPVLVSGSREPLSRALLRGMATCIEHFWTRKSSPLLAKVKDLLQALEAGDTITGRQIVRLFQEMARRVSDSGRASGLLIVIDELGKLLEYTASHPRESDIFVLQELAEATKDNSEYTIFLATILHQSFEHYVERLGRTQKEEWMKVQGRFEDIPFQEPVDQLLRILAQAIEFRGEIKHIQALKRYGHALASRAWEQKLLGAHTIKRKEQIEVLAACVPLHPTVALLLGYLFRRIGQNERSLFAFLTSREPHGFQEFIEQSIWSKKQSELLRLDRVYDYIITALGSALYAGADGKLWAEIEAALNRLPDPTELEIQLIKGIGLLRIIGDIGGLKSSETVLNFAFESDTVKPEKIKAALARLRQRSIVVYRRYNDTYSLWEGSDIDIEACLREARAHIDANESLAASLTKYFKPRAIIARRHSMQTGTLRYFDVRYVDSSNLEEAAHEPLGDSDGRILYPFTLDVDELKLITDKVATSTITELSQVIIAIPYVVDNLRKSVFDVACLRWVQDNTPELEGDRAARNELHARLSRAESSVETMLQSFFDPTATDTGCVWLYKGERINVHGSRALQELVSDICDKVFDKTPVLRNELINRRHISSSAASARRELLAAMLAHADKKALNIEGFPPHSSMYFSLLQETGIHREENGRWGFLPPRPDANAGVRAVWEAIDGFLSETEIERRSVAGLFDLLRRPPYGMKNGPLPVLLCAALLHFDTEVALYEQGSFVPSLSNAVFERLVKAPDNFQLQRCRVAGVRAIIFERFANVLVQKPEGFATQKMNLLIIVRSLTRFAVGLPAYTKNTQRLSTTTLQIRGALFEAREPDKLLFTQLPEACGHAPFTINDRRGTREVDAFFKRLRESLSELQRAYDDLLGVLEQLLVIAFSLKSTGADARLELATRAQPLIDLTVDPKLKSFILRVLDDGLDLRGWIESIATLLSGKFPTSWNDADLARYEVNLAEITRSFRHIELLSFEMSKHEILTTSATNEMLRLGVTVPREAEHQRVMIISQQERLLIERAEDSVERALYASGLNGNTELHLAVLAKLSRKLLIQAEEDDQVDLRQRAAKKA